ncbi:acyl-coA-sterol acyltransferase [Schizosaccharomyces japonicus yFS275]|uniref:O-acyltransferase n=1 Tax=Schizosaccharomyces japonicus (strain yFS275 / FY16936) TaxID=402676 RepID=B6K5T3_SCHJY|nr:acyl-coA-sterol acyltransferase [Schizosaccharomyces japonicus yFS275]EEB08887.1 acyl-coA-sterol acyltransferase [Schizosaccharomyces japonicus yFS275]
MSSSNSTVSTSSSKSRHEVHPSREALIALHAPIITVKDSKGEKVIASFNLSTSRNLLLEGKVYHDYKFQESRSFLDEYTSWDNFEKNDFHGFYVLFWIAVIMWMTQIFVQNYYVTGLPADFRLLRSYSRPYKSLFLSDLIMVSLSVVSYVLQRLIVMGKLRWEGTGKRIQYVWQGFYLLGSAIWMKYKQFGMGPGLYFILHCAVMIMKQYSYSHHLGFISEAARLRDKLHEKLHAIRAAQRAAEEQHGELQCECIYNNDKLARSMSVQAVDDLLVLHCKYLSRQLRSESGNVCYPHNVTLKNYLDYLLVPSLVYSLEFPRVKTFSWRYLAIKLAGTLGIIVVMFVIAEKYIEPLSQSLADYTLKERFERAPLFLFDLLFPCIVLYFLTFYLIFDCILNAFAEITHFADRRFYGLWWNTVTWNEFSREWNKPVHVFLLRHVYHSSLVFGTISRSNAVFLTYLVSALVHEFVMFLTTGKLRCYIMCMQLLQIPLYHLSQTKLLKNRRLFGNVFFWVGLFSGPTFLCILYMVF